MVNTVFSIILSHSDFLNDYKKYGADSFICPKGFLNIHSFVKYCKESPGACTVQKFSVDDNITLNLGDEVLLNNVYYRVSKKSYNVKSNTIIYDLIY